MEDDGNPRHAERSLAIAYARPAARAGLAALLSLDDALSRVVRTTREPMIGQLRLAWWREALAGLDRSSVPAEPVLGALAASVIAGGVEGRQLADMADGWERLFGEIDDRALAAFAADRGGRLFRIGTMVLGGAATPMLERAGEGWALADLAGNLADATAAGRARTLAADRLAGVFARRWPRALRPLGALALFARADLAGIPPGSPRRTARVLGHRLTGR